MQQDIKMKHCPHLNFNIGELSLLVSIQMKTEELQIIK